MEDKKSTDAELLHSFKEEKKNTPYTMKTLGIFIVVILLGVATGFVLAKGKANGGGLHLPGTSSSNVQSGQTVGSSDTKTYKDTAEGTVKDGGINGEGQFHLERPGGASQSVAMTSSLVDLSQFIGRKVKVWGQTQSSQKAGWLMDVGRVEVE